MSLHTLSRCVLSVIFLTAMSVFAEPDHFVLTELPILLMARMDPIVNNGEVSAHTHFIVGGSNFRQSLNSPEEQRAADCSTTIVGDDMSNYWSPLLYYRYPNDTLVPILGTSRIYYFTKTDNVKPFPPGLRMITGTAMSRDVTSDPAQGLAISCNHGARTQWLPNATSHPGGCSSISMGIYFPSCGLASGDVHSEDHFSHMAWPLKKNETGFAADVNGKVCPDSHPIKYPTIFMEVNYYLNSDQPWRNDENLLVLSNGDTTGAAYHADFLNGWNQQVLTDAIAECGDGKGVGDKLANCAPLAKSLSIDAARDCRYQNQIPDEEIGLFRPIDKLPGCNPIWPASMSSKPTCDTAVPDPAFVSPNLYFENLKYRMHIPLALAANGSEHSDDSTTLLALTPSLGETGASRLKVWGADGSNKGSLKQGSLGQILAGLAPDQAEDAGVTDKSPKDSSVPSSAATPSETKALPEVGVAMADAQSSPAPASSSKIPVTDVGKAPKSKTCKKKKRALLAKEKSTSSSQSTGQAHADLAEHRKRKRSHRSSLGSL